MTLRQTQHRRPRGAFTLMEMLIVVAIIVMLAGVAAYSYTRYLEQARENTAKLQITHLQEAVMEYNTSNGSFPASLEELTAASEGKPAALEQKDLLDPWGKQYSYEPNNVSPTGKPRIATQSPGGTPIANW
jgi:general secretion pathway protein G